MFYKKKYLDLKKAYDELRSKYILDAYNIQMLRKTNDHLGYRIVELEEDCAHCVKQTLCRVEELSKAYKECEKIDEYISGIISKIMEENQTNKEEREEEVQTSLFDM